LTHFDPVQGLSDAYTSDPSPQMTRWEFQFLRELVYQSCRIHLGEEKRELLLARLQKRMRRVGISSIKDYLQLLQNPDTADEVEALIAAITTNHTFFFRERAHFEFIRSQFLPSFLAAVPKGGPRTLRIWSAGCSSGEEVYSLSMILQEFALSHPGLNWSIDGSDISKPMLDSACQGIYPSSALEHVPVPLQRKYFQMGTGAQEGRFRVKSSLTHQVSFHHLNLFAPTYPFQYPFDLILCRNVMIYFDRDTQAELMDRLVQELKPGGHLLIGHSESLTGFKHPLEPVQAAIYRRPDPHHSL